METLKSHHNNTFRIVPVESGRTIFKWLVYKMADVEWPPEKEIADLCDPFSCHYEVEFFDEFAKVTIYTD